MLRIIAISLMLSLCGCVTAFETPQNHTDLENEAYQAEFRAMPTRSGEWNLKTARMQNFSRCQDMDIAMAGNSADIGLGAAFDAPELLSPGDLLRIEIYRGDGFEGDYVISASGYLRIPFLGDIPAAGSSASDIENIVSRLLVAGGYFKSSFVQVSVSVLDWAPIQVSVSGAVFQSGDVLLNQPSGNADATIRTEASGDSTLQRRLSSALSAAAGIRPDADVRNVVLTRNGRRRVFDMTGALDGRAVEDPLLVAGDRLHVPSRGCFQVALARPSRITPPGVRVFMSNLTRPSTSNANSAIGQYATQFPYGTRFLQGLVSANCVGGIKATNAGRFAVLISRNPVTGHSEVIGRSIEELVTRADRDAFNPVLLPNDAIACYDSKVTNMRDVVATVSEATGPILSGLILGGFPQ